MNKVSFQDGKLAINIGQSVALVPVVGIALEAAQKGDLLPAVHVLLDEVQQFLNYCKMFNPAALWTADAKMRVEKVLRDELAGLTRESLKLDAVGTDELFTALS